MRGGLMQISGEPGWSGVESRLHGGIFSGNHLMCPEDLDPREARHLIRVETSNGS